MVVWMLQHRLLIQLHTYIFFVPPVRRQTQKLEDSMRKPFIQEEWGLLDGGLQRSPSFSDAASGIATLDSVDFSIISLCIHGLSI